MEGVNPRLPLLNIAPCRTHCTTNLSFEGLLSRTSESETQASYGKTKLCMYKHNNQKADRGSDVRRIILNPEA